MQQIHPLSLPVCYPKQTLFLNGIQTISDLLHLFHLFFYFRFLLLKPLPFFLNLLHLFVQNLFLFQEPCFHFFQSIFLPGISFGRFLPAGLFYGCFGFSFFFGRCRRGFFLHFRCGMVFVFRMFRCLFFSCGCFRFRVRFRRRVFLWFGGFLRFSVLRCWLVFLTDQVSVFIKEFIIFRSRNHPPRLNRGNAQPDHCCLVFAVCRVMRIVQLPDIIYSAKIFPVQYIGFQIDAAFNLRNPDNFQSPPPDHLLTGLNLCFEPVPSKKAHASRHKIAQMRLQIFSIPVFPHPLSLHPFFYQYALFPPSCQAAPNPVLNSPPANGWVM